VSPLTLIRDRLTNAGNEQQQMQVLRKLLASTEDPRMLRALAAALEEFRDCAAEEILCDLADFADRLHEKGSRLGAVSPSPRRVKPKCALSNIRTTVAPQARMVVTPWITDELGNLSREVYADPAGTLRL
jgi:hypothetical protein